MSERDKTRPHERWAHLRFSVVGPLLASPPRRGELQAALRELAAKEWQQPITGQRVRFGVSTLERWFYLAKRETRDPVGVLRRRVRQDAGTHRGMRPSPARPRHAVPGARDVELPASHRQPRRPGRAESRARSHAVLLHHPTVHEGLWPAPQASAPERAAR